MPNAHTFIFKKRDIQKLLEKDPDFVVVKVSTLPAILDNGKKACVIEVVAEAIVKGKPKPLATVYGCPDPPCSIDDRK